MIGYDVLMSQGHASDVSYPATHERNMNAVACVCGGDAAYFVGMETVVCRSEIRQPMVGSIATRHGCNFSPADRHVHVLYR